MEATVICFLNNTKKVYNFTALFFMSQESVRVTGILNGAEFFLQPVYFNFDAFFVWRGWAWRGPLHGKIKGNEAQPGREQANKVRGEGKIYQGGVLRDLFY